MSTSTHVQASIYRLLLRTARQVEHDPVARSCLLAPPQKLYLHESNRTVPCSVPSTTFGKILQAANRGGEFYRPERDAGLVRCIKRGRAKLVGAGAGVSEGVGGGGGEQGRGTALLYNENEGPFVASTTTDLFDSVKLLNQVGRDFFLFKEEDPCTRVSPVDNHRRICTGQQTHTHTYHKLWAHFSHAVQLYS